MDYVPKPDPQDGLFDMRSPALCFFTMGRRTIPGTRH